MYTIEFRRGYAIDWTTKNPILRLGEPGFERDTGKIKIGDGVTAWNSLAYLAGDSDSDGGTSDVDLNNHINSSTPHPIYDDGPSLVLLYENAKV